MNEQITGNEERKASKEGHRMIEVISLVIGRTDGRKNRFIVEARYEGRSEELRRKQMMEETSKKYQNGWKEEWVYVEGMWKDYRRKQASFSVE